MDQMKNLEYTHLKNAFLAIFQVSFEYMFTQCKYKYVYMNPDTDSLLACLMLPAY